ncbi:PKD domain-containing protein [Candidatus Peregrinibacteria bacterium]|nr:PKD domain-containing protein [Candidatus Peregrinibacteria bacterium]
MENNNPQPANKSGTSASGGTQPATEISAINGTTPATQTFTTNGAAPATQTSTTKETTPATETSATKETAPATQTSATTGTVSPASAKTVKKSVNKTRTFIGCLAGIFGIFIFTLLSITLIFVTGGENNAFLQLVGIDMVSLYQFLIDAINMTFGMLVFITFLVSMIGIFRVGMMKKDDKIGRGKGLKMFFFGLIAFIIFLTIWVTSYIYLRSKVPLAARTRVSPIETMPENTIGLTAPLAITFDASGIPLSQAKILQYEWNFGDGQSATGNPTTHIYKSKGKGGLYTVILTVTYNDFRTQQNAKMQFEKDISFANEKVDAAFTVSIEKGPAPLIVDFDASGSIDPDGEIVAYDWDLDEDGMYDDSTTVKVSKTFEQVGSYKIALRVTDNNGEYDTFEKTIEVEAPTVLTAVIKNSNSEKNFYIGETYTFDGSESSSPNGIIQKYTWNFGDGTNEVSAKNASHTFSKSGTYSVTLKIIDEKGATGEASTEITVIKPEAAPKAEVRTVPEYDTEKDGSIKIQGIVPLRIQFDASKSIDLDNNIVDYQWDFNGDGKADAFGPQVDHNFETAGKYQISLVVVDGDGQKGTWNALTVAESRGIYAEVKSSPNSGIAPVTIDFDASGSSYAESEIVSYEWDFGDGTPKRIGNAQISYRYEKIGEFTAKVTVIASDGKKAEATTNIYIRPVALKACFEANVKEGKAPLIVTFDPRCSEGSIVKYTWRVDEKTMKERDITYTFEKAGTYEVILEVIDNENVTSKYFDTVTVKE